MKNTNKLNEEIINDDAKFSFINQFLEETNLWHDLCGNKLYRAKNNSEKKLFNKNTQYYPYEKLTFAFILYNQFSKKTIFEVREIFLNSLFLYEKILQKQGITNKNDMVDDFKIRVVIATIFQNINNEPYILHKIKDQYKNFCMTKELNNNLTINMIEKKKNKI